MIDLTKIEKPFGLLDKETQERLKAHGGPYEYYLGEGEWHSMAFWPALWYSDTVYRAKPPRQPEIIQTTVMTPKFIQAPEKPEVKVGSWWKDKQGVILEVLCTFGDAAFARICESDEYAETVSFDELIEHCTPYTPPRKCEGWVNVYEVDGELKLGIKTYPNEKEAEDGTLHYTKRITTIKIEYMEDQDND